MVSKKIIVALAFFAICSVFVFAAGEEAIIGEWVLDGVYEHTWETEDEQDSFWWLHPAHAMEMDSYEDGIEDGVYRFFPDGTGEFESDSYRSSYTWSLISLPNAYSDTGAAGGFSLEWTESNGESSLYSLISISGSHFILLYLYSPWEYAVGAAVRVYKRTGA